MTSTISRPAPQAPTPQQLATLREQLEEQRRFRLDQLARLQAIDPNEVSEVLALGARSALHEITAALQRMATGRYGHCTDCDGQVALARLEVIPQVARCLRCHLRTVQGA